MNGDFLRKKIEESGFQLVEVAKNLGITPQDLQSKLKSKDVKVSFLENLASAINRNVYYFFDNLESIDNISEIFHKKNQKKSNNDIEFQNDIFEKNNLKAIIEEQKSIITELKDQILFYKEKSLDKTRNSVEPIDASKLNYLYELFKEREFLEEIKQLGNTIKKPHE